MRKKIFTLVFGWITCVSFSQETPKTISWSIDNLESIGGNPVTLQGAPKVVEKDGHKAVEFNGKSDGLFINANPMIGATSEFTIEVVFMPYADGNHEQRFVHFQQDDNNRILVELRMTKGRWILDTFIKSGSSSKTLLSTGQEHDADKWAHGQLVYKDNTMTHYVDGKKELDGGVTYKPVTAGKTSIGVRQNKVSWFRGAIRMLRVTHKALSPEEFLSNDIVFVGGHSRHSGISFDKIFLTPNTQSVTLDFSVPQAGPYIINLVNPNGMVINSLLSLNPAPGRNSIRFNFKTPSPGIYIFSLKGNDACISKKWVLPF